MIAPLMTITCDLTIDNPHPSTHVPETVNVVAHWSCDAPVANLSMAVSLYYEGTEVGQGSSSNQDQATLNGNAAAACKSGYYYGFANGTAVAPPGYSPPSQSSDVQSPTVYVLC